MILFCWLYNHLLISDCCSTGIFSPSPFPSVYMLPTVNCWVDRKLEKQATRFSNTQVLGLLTFLIIFKNFYSSLGSLLKFNKTTFISFISRFDHKFKMYSLYLFWYHFMTKQPIPNHKVLGLRTFLNKNFYLS